MPVMTFLLFALLACFDVPALVRERKRRDIIVFSVMAALALTYMLRMSMGLSVPSAIRSLCEFTQKTLGLDYENWR